MALPFKVASSSQAKQGGIIQRLTRSPPDFGVWVALPFKVALSSQAKQDGIIQRLHPFKVASSQAKQDGIIQRLTRSPSARLWCLCQRVIVEDVHHSHPLNKG
uniref:Uncharacterized protein n=1 Tax=Oryza sativa subsp. japonica TaxID=39947 RepID=Q6Z100_ORYSJ|nr:hypothetical protein [Oryza sativa Japonica Group]BAD33261.1 hypothetical protein [Oryza sativa Japonica Group]